MKPNRTKPLIVSIIMFFLIIYFGWESRGLAAFKNTFDDFTNVYLDNVQKYLYIISLFAATMFYFVRIPFLRPEYRIRINVSLYDFLIEKNIVNSLFITLAIYMLYIFASVFYDFSFVFSITYIFLFMRLYGFVYLCGVIYLLSYLSSENEIFGFVCIIAINLFVLMIYLSVNFIFNNCISDKFEMLIFSFYITFFDIFCSLYLMLKSDKKESLK